MFLAAAAAGIARAQDASFSTDVKVVNVLATVRDKQGNIVTSLGKDDFDLAVDGHPQGIQYFSRDTDLPLTLGLLVDTSGSQRMVLGEERDASRRFIEHVIREDRDQTFLIHFDHDTELLQDLTPSKAKLERALDQVQLPPDQNRQGGYGGGGNPGGGYPGGGYPGGGGSTRRGGQRQAGTTLYDAVLLASDDLMRKRQGRKALIVLSDGVDNGSKEPLSAAIESAQRADTLVYTILFKGQESQPYFPRGYGRRGGIMIPPPQSQRPDGKRVMEQMARETGGGFFEVSNKMSIEQIYDRIDEELRSQYSIGFTPEKVTDTAFRRINLTVKQKGMTVQTRDGYYPS